MYAIYVDLCVEEKLFVDNVNTSTKTNSLSRLKTNILIKIILVSVLSVVKTFSVVNLVQLTDFFFVHS